MGLKEAKVHEAQSLERPPPPPHTHTHSLKDRASPTRPLLTNHGGQHLRMRRLSPEQEQGQAPAQRHFRSEDSSVERVQHRCGALHPARRLVGGTCQGHGQQAFPRALFPGHSGAVGGGYLQGEGEDAQLCLPAAWHLPSVSTEQPLCAAPAWRTRSATEAGGEGPGLCLGPLSLRPRDSQRPPSREGRRDLRVQVKAASWKEEEGGSRAAPAHRFPGRSVAQCSGEQRRGVTGAPLPTAPASCHRLTRRL